MIHQRYTVVLLLLAVFLIQSCDNSGSSGDASATLDSSAAKPIIVDSVPYTISLKPAEIQPAIGLHSFAYATHEGKWLIVGGRKDGFHRTSALGGNFTTQFANEDFIVIDPAAGKMWTTPIPSSFLPFLRSTNMQFCQDGNVLYVIGGYGSSCEENTPDCYGTYANVTAISIPEIIHGIMRQNQGLTHHLVSITDPRMQVTGGGLQKIGEYFYLTFGQNYKQEYEAGVTGEYTEQIRRFKLSTDFRKESLVVSAYEEFSDPTGVKGKTSLYHRRDLNVLEAVRPDGKKGISVYGGVFDSTGGGWVNPIYVDVENGAVKVEVDMSFEQKTNQYECANMLVFDPNTKTMYTTLFGGIGAYKYVQDVLTPDPLLPFENIISTIIRRSDGSTIQAIQPATEVMPKLLGANGLFAPSKDVAMYGGTEEVIDFSKLPTTNPMLIGYFYGGILAYAPHSDEARPTEANKTIYEVWLTRK